MGPNNNVVILLILNTLTFPNDGKSISFHECLSSVAAHWVHMHRLYQSNHLFFLFVGQKHFNHMHLVLLNQQRGGNSSKDPKSTSKMRKFAFNQTIFGLAKQEKLEIRFFFRSNRFGWMNDVSRDNILRMIRIAPAFIILSVRDQGMRRKTKEFQWKATNNKINLRHMFGDCYLSRAPLLNSTLLCIA